MKVNKEISNHKINSFNLTPKGFEQAEKRKQQGYGFIILAEMSVTVLVACPASNIEEARDWAAMAAITYKHAKEIHIVKL